MKIQTQTIDIQDKLTPKDAFNILADGNKRFTKNVRVQRNLQSQVLETSKGQFPFAVILSCIDSRVPTELIFDQGIGDVFCTRIAGNIINEDILGSMEYSCKVAGAKIIVVMGHTKCGAVTAACKNFELGNITPLLKKIEPAINLVRKSEEEMDEKEIEEVSVENVRLSIDRIRKESNILSEMEKNKHIEIIGALYHVSNGKVDFLKDN